MNNIPYEDAITLIGDYITDTFPGEEVKRIPACVESLMKNYPEKSHEEIYNDLQMWVEYLCNINRK